MKALPDLSHTRLKKLRIFLMYGPKAEGGGRDNGLEYFQRDAPKYHKELDPHWASAIVVYNASNYIGISDLWALKALVHEFAHAYQLERWPENQPDIYNAWANSVRQGLYHNVRDESGKVVENAYAAVNQLEYFAELSCMYFVGCNYEPFNRKDLEAYDSVGFAMIEKMWQVNRER